MHIDCALLYSALNISRLQVVELDGPLFCLSWCKRKRWLLVGGKAQLHVYSVCSASSNPFASRSDTCLTITHCAWFVICQDSVQLCTLPSATQGTCRSNGPSAAEIQCLTVCLNLASLQLIDKSQLHAQSLQLVCLAWLV